MPHLSAVSHVAYSGDGRRILTAGWNSLARVWDADTGLPLTEWLSAGGLPTGLCFDAMGRRLATSARPGFVRVWEIPPAPTPVPAWFPAFAEAVAGARWSERGHLEMPASEALERFAGDPDAPDANGFYERLGRWILADPAHRPRSPW
jgi:WD40 repeat protein